MSGNRHKGRKTLLVVGFLFGAICFMSPLYKLTLRNMDPEKIQFHVESDDYFATLATVLNIHAEQLENPKWGKGIDHPEKLRGLMDDLMFLQENYKIVRRAESDVTLF